MFHIWHLSNRTASIKIIKTTHEWSYRRALSRRWKTSTREGSEYCPTAMFRRKNSQQCTEFPSKRFPTLLAILVPQFIAFDSLVKRNLSGPTQWNAEWKFLPEFNLPLFYLERLSEITGGEDLILSDRLVFFEITIIITAFVGVLETNKQIKY